MCGGSRRRQTGWFGNGGSCDLCHLLPAACCLLQGHGGRRALSCGAGLHLCVTCVVRLCVCSRSMRHLDMQRLRCDIKDFDVGKVRVRTAFVLNVFIAGRPPAANCWRLEPLSFPAMTLPSCLPAPSSRRFPAWTATGRGWRWASTCAAQPRTSRCAAARGSGRGRQGGRGSRRAGCGAWRWPPAATTAAAGGTLWRRM